MCVVLVLVAVRFGLWTMMAELCFSVDDFILGVFSNTVADTDTHKIIVLFQSFRSLSLGLCVGTAPQNMGTTLQKLGTTSYVGLLWPSISAVRDPATLGFCFLFFVSSYIVIRSGLDSLGPMSLTTEALLSAITWLAVYKMRSRII